MEFYKEDAEKYKRMVKNTEPKSPVVSNCIKAFIVGGGICVIGQILTNNFNRIGYSQDDSALITNIIFILATAILTGLGLFSKIGRFSGAGTIVPITGFANSVVSPAIEFKKEGFIMGLGSKMFIVAGPVIVYGVLTSMAAGIIYYFWRFF